MRVQTYYPKARRNLFCRPILINFSLFIILSLVIISITSVYILKEKTFYFWDLSNYSSKTSDLAEIFRQSPLQIIQAVGNSFGDDYNLLPCVPLLPFNLIFGDSRLVYIISCAVIYILPFTLIVGAIATKIIPVYPRAVFWSTVFVTLLIPPTWVATLRGYPDIGAAIFIGLAILVYLKDVKLQSGTRSRPQSWWQIPVIGFLLALSFLFRRHFAYSARAFVAAMICQGLLIFFKEVQLKPRKAIKKIFRYFIAIGLICITILFVLKLLTPAFLNNILANNYRSLYASYERSIVENLQYYGQAYGWLLWFFTILGFSVGIVTRVVVLPATFFIVIFGSLSLAQWMIFSKQIQPHYTTHFTPLIALGITTLIWTIGLIWKKILPIILTLIILLSNFVFGLTFIGNNNNSLSSLLSFNMPPIVRKDYDQVKRLIDYIKNLNTENQPIFVAASSHTLNDSLLQVAQKQIYGKIIFPVLDTPDIDSRDYYPLSPLLKAQYVILATPFQYHIPPEEQDVVKVVVDAFIENWQLTQDFRRLPEQFILDKGIQVNIYERIRPTSAATFLQTLNLMRQRVQPQPNGQSDWIIFSKTQSNHIVNTSNNTVKIDASFDSDSFPSFLYFGTLNKDIKLTGEVTNFNCSNSKDLTIQLSGLNQQGKPINNSKVLLSSIPANFSLFLKNAEPVLKPNQNLAYLRLDVINNNLDKINESCFIVINNLTKSNRQ